MEVMLLGVKPVSFTPRGESQEKSGLTVYYTAESPEVIGLFADSVWVDKAKTPKWYNSLSSMDFEKPVPAQFVYEILPGRKAPLLSNIIINGQ